MLHAIVEWRAEIARVITAAAASPTAELEWRLGTVSAGVWRAGGHAHTELRARLTGAKWTAPVRTTTLLFGEGVRVRTGRVERKTRITDITLPYLPVAARLALASEVALERVPAGAVPVGQREMERTEADVPGHPGARLMLSTVDGAHPEIEIEFTRRPTAVAAVAALECVLRALLPERLNMTTESAAITAAAAYNARWPTRSMQGLLRRVGQRPVNVARGDIAALAAYAVSNKLDGVRYLIVQHQGEIWAIGESDAQVVTHIPPAWNADSTADEVTKSATTTAGGYAVIGVDDDADATEGGAADGEYMLGGMRVRRVRAPVAVRARAPDALAPGMAVDAEWEPHTRTFWAWDMPGASADDYRARMRATEAAVARLAHPAVRCKRVEWGAGAAARVLARMPRDWGTEWRARNDGLIFTPIAEPYIANQSTLKWKWPDRISVDLRLVATTGGLTAHEHLFLTAMQGTRGEERATPSVRVVPTDAAWSWARAGQIVEIVWRGGEYHVERLRADKTLPNFLRTVASTLHDMHNPVALSEIVPGAVSRGGSVASATTSASAVAAEPLARAPGLLAAGDVLERAIEAAAPHIADDRAWYAPARACTLAFITAQRLALSNPELLAGAEPSGPLNIYTSDGLRTANSLANALYAVNPIVFMKTVLPHAEFEVSVLNRLVARVLVYPRFKHIRTASVFRTVPTTLAPTIVPEIELMAVYHRLYMPFPEHWDAALVLEHALAPRLTTIEAVAKSEVVAEAAGEIAEADSSAAGGGAADGAVDGGYGSDDAGSELDAPWAPDASAWHEVGDAVRVGTLDVVAVDGGRHGSRDRSQGQGHHDRAPGQGQHAHRAHHARAREVDAAREAIRHAMQYEELGVLVGHWAYHELRGGQRPYEKIQFLSDLEPQELASRIERVLRASPNVGRESTSVAMPAVDAEIVSTEATGGALDALEVRTERVEIPGDMHIHRTTFYMQHEGERVPVADAFNSLKYEMVPWTMGSNKLHIGNPWVLARFMLIDAYTLRVLGAGGMVPPDVVARKVATLCDRVMELRTMSGTGGTDYAGTYLDAAIERRRLLRAEPRFAPYRPMEWHERNGKLREIDARPAYTAHRERR